MSDDRSVDVPKSKLEPEMLLYGFVWSVGRFTRSGLSGESLTDLDESDDPDRQVLPVEWTAAVFDALNWSVTLDERLRHEFEGKDWTADLEGGGVIRALRYARNCVHHDWSAALDLGIDLNKLLAPHSAVFGITWTRESEGENVGETRLAAVKICQDGISMLRSATTPTPEVNRDVKSLALYHCVYDEEDFDKAAEDLFDLVATTAKRSPLAKRDPRTPLYGRKSKVTAKRPARRTPHLP